MTPTELRRRHCASHPDSHFFDKKTMQFFGDTMANFGVRTSRVADSNGKVTDAWMLRRKRPVRHNLQSPHFFAKDDFRELVNIARVLA